MIAVAAFLAGAWMCAWGLYSTMVAQMALRRATAAIVGPAGVLLMAGSLVSLLVPGFWGG